MRRFNSILAVFLLGSAMHLGVAWADIIEIKSKISEINVSTISTFIKVYRLDPQTEKTEEIKVEVDDSTRLGEIESLRDLEVGEEVVIEANYNAFTHDWKAQSIRPAEKRDL